MGSGLAKDESDKRVMRACWFCAKSSKDRTGSGQCTNCDEDGFEALGAAKTHDVR